MTDPGPLAGVRVVDLTDDYGAYASRLLSDLGADVVRVRLPADGHAWQGPQITVDGERISLVDRFVDAGKVVVAADGLRTEDLEQAIGAADILLHGDAAFDHWGLSEDVVDRRNPGLIRVAVSAFGREAPTAADSVDDLIVLGAGGLLHLGGYRDLGPMGAWGGQSTVAASVFAAAAAVAGLLARQSSGSGLSAEVSAQEAVAQALEDSVAEFALTGRARDRRGERPQEAGTGTYPCADGYVSMVAGRLGTARAWRSLADWLIDARIDGAEALAGEPWIDFEYRRSQEGIGAFAEIFGRFAADRTMESLYREAQARGIALSPVNDLAGVVADRQLAARGFYVEVEDDDLGTLTFPGAPYRLSVTPPRAPTSYRRGDRESLARFSRGEAL